MERSPAAAAACPPTALVSLLILTCNRHAFLRLTLAAAAAQTYTNLEVVVVDDGPRPLPRAVLKSFGLPMRLVRLSTRRSIGSKRNAGLRVARGAVIIHFDDDDLHSPEQVATLACPILRGVADITAPTFSLLAKLSVRTLTFHDVRAGRTTRRATGAFLGALAYSRTVAARLSRDTTRQDHGSTALLAPSSADGTSARLVGSTFANVSLSEDLDFVERALTLCFRMLPIARPPTVAYTRHADVMMNTWRPADYEARMAGPGVQPPPFIDNALARAYIEAERDADRLGACGARSRHEPPGLVRHRATDGLRFPYMPPYCCSGAGSHRERRPCTDAAFEGGSCGEETFCGAIKGTCTARCICPGEQGHSTALAPHKCGASCCRYWHRFWSTHPENCTLTRGPRRPLRAHYCGSRARRPAAPKGRKEAQKDKEGEKHIAHLKNGNRDAPHHPRESL